MQSYKNFCNRDCLNYCFFDNTAFQPYHAAYKQLISFNLSLTFGGY